MPDDGRDKLGAPQIHLSELTVGQLINLTDPLEIIYHRSTIPIAYILPATPQVQEFVRKMIEEGR